MRTKFIVLAVAILLAAFSQLRAIPDVPTLQVDTLVDLSKTGGGEAGGALFLPDGNIIAIWKSIPHVIDSKTGEVIRRMDTIKASPLNYPRITKNGLRFGAISEGIKLKIWDVPTGKLLFQPKNSIYDFCFSPDGTKLYGALSNEKDNPGTIVVYDMATFEEIERLSFTSVTWGGPIDISPDGQTLAVSVGYKINDTFNNKFILINLNDKQNYTSIESLKLQINSMEFSPDGNQVSFLYNGSDDLYIYIYNLETKEKKYIRKAELSVLFGGANIAAIGKPKFIDSNHIYSGFKDGTGKLWYSFSWNIPENRIKNYFDFLGPVSVGVNDSILLFCNGAGVIGITNKKAVPVKDIIVPKENNITYKNNQLEYFSNKPFIGESYLYDINGKLIAYLGTQLFKSGNNTIPVNHPILNGVYLLTIISDTEYISKKFMVE
ncbi:MAG: T9SS type A sorting domain-containing protein [bacterium]